jgi:hypothetical protein
MLNQILKWAAIAALWAKVKPIFWGTLATVLFILTVNAVHAEFVEFLRVDQELAGTSGPLVTDVRVWLVFSYLGKLSLILVSTAAWLFYLQRKGWFGAGRQPISSKKAPEKAHSSGSATAQKTPPSSKPAPARFSEEFEFLRTDRPLKSRGQAILDAKRSA